MVRKKEKQGERVQMRGGRYDATWGQHRMDAGLGIGVQLRGP